MKKLFTCAFSLALPFMVSAQFSEDFNFPGNNAAYDLPNGWTTYDLDGNTPTGQLAQFFDKAWKMIRWTTGDQAAASYSNYSPAGQSNDWMITPQINVPATTPFLVFDVKVPISSTQNDYKVYISTSGNTPGDTTALLLSSNTSSTSYAKQAISLSAYAGQQVYISFVNIQNAGQVIMIDNIQVLSLPNNDLSIENVILPKYSTVSTNNTLNIEVKNMGGNVINTADITWSDGTNNYTFNATNLNLQPLTTTIITHNTQVSYSTVVEKNINLNATNINGNPDADSSDNVASTTFHTVSSVPVKNVVIEEGTGTWCGYCPRGAVAMDYMVSNFTNFIGIAVHNGDPMTVSAYDNGANFGAFPNCNIDRDILGESVSQSIWVSYYNQRKTMVTPAGVNVVASYDSVSKVVTAVAYANFVTNFAQANLRLAVVVYENGVTGTSSGYDQSNYYSGGGNGPMGGYENKPNPVPASQMVYDHVGRALLGGYSGQPSSVPTTIADGDSVSYSFTYTVPGTQNPDALHVVAFLLDNSTGEILNAGEVKVTSTSPIAVKELTSIQDLKLYPNPAREFVNITFGLEKTSDVMMSIYTTGGKLVRTENYQHLTGTQNLQINVSNMAAGQYLISFATENGAVVKQLIVQ